MEKMLCLLQEVRESHQPARTKTGNHCFIGMPPSHWEVCGRALGFWDSFRGIRDCWIAPCDCRDQRFAGGERSLM